MFNFVTLIKQKRSCAMVTEITAAILAETWGRIMGKVFNLVDDKKAFTFEILKFSICTWSGVSSDEYNAINDGKANESEYENSPGIIALVEIANLSKEAFRVSNFFLTSDENKIEALILGELKQEAAYSSWLEIEAEHVFRTDVNCHFNVVEKLGSPYLLPNDSQRGLIGFRFPKRLSGSSFSICAKIPGSLELLSASLL
jgi:hypothetical protein